MYFFDLLIRILKVTIISVVNFLITCIVFDLVKDKDTSQLPYWILKKSMTSHFFRIN